MRIQLTCVTSSQTQSLHTENLPSLFPILVM